MNKDSCLYDMKLSVISTYFSVHQKEATEFLYLATSLQFTAKVLLKTLFRLFDKVKAKYEDIKRFSRMLQL